MAGFCYQCGQPMTLGIPPNEDTVREYCRDCGYVHYVNPKVQVGVIVSCRDRMLWMKRANQPRAGYWALPGGFMEINESLREAAARELLEETGVRVDLASLHLYVVGTVGHLNQVHVLFRTEVADDSCCPGTEALAVEWFDEDSAPWSELAFNDTTPGCRLFYRDLKQGNFGAYYAEQDEQSIVITDILPGPASDWVDYQSMAEDFFDRKMQKRG